MEKLEAWLRAFRLRTLPLSLSSVILGSLLAYFKGSFEFSVLAGAAATTLFLQILSNLANDYGDAKSGVDNDRRTGPQRAVHSGEISANEMRVGIGIFALLAFGSGIWLLTGTAVELPLITVGVFVVLGLMAIAAAVFYTVGRRPYGYIGLGDLAVFVFFGLCGVLGTFFLHTQNLTWTELLPAASMGFLATGVLNLNNMRDRESDQQSGKRSLAVLLGEKRSKLYHQFLLGMAIACAVSYTALHFRSGYQFLWLVTVPMIVQNMIVVWNNTRPSELDGELRKLAFSTLFFAVTFGLGLIY